MTKHSIAFLTRSLANATSCDIWNGIVSACKKADLPVVTFRGPVLNQGAGSIIYHLITDNSFSGIISWASSDVDKKTVEFYQKYQKTPLVCLTFQVPGHPVVNADCRSGIIELVSHLIEVHGIKKIAFIRGPENHVYSKERYEGYLECLKNHNIEIDHKIISPCGDWVINSGKKAIKRFIESGLKPGVDFQAVVAVGDNVAIGAQEELLERGFSIPRDIAVCGFNGTEDAACCNPPITSVEMPFYGMGERSFDTVQSLINGENVPSVFKYQSKMFLGESCGCVSSSVKLAKYIKEKNAAEAEKKIIKKGLFKKVVLTKKSKKDMILKIMSPEWQKSTSIAILSVLKKNRYNNEQIEKFFKNWTGKLLQKFADELSGKVKRGENFVELISKGINRYSLTSKEFSVWQDVLSILRNEVLKVVESSTLQIIVENIFQQARLVVSEVDIRTQKLTTLLAARKEAEIRNTSEALLSCSDVRELMNIVAKSIKKHGISGCYVALYNNCEYTEENHRIPKTSRMILAVHAGERIPLSEGGVEFETTEIIPDSLLRNEHFSSFVVESLHYQDSYLGYIVFETELTDRGTIFATLREQISSSLYGALVLADREKNRAKLETTMETMTSKADVVSEQSAGITENITKASHSMNDFTQSIKNISGNITNVTDTVETTTRMVSDANESIANLVESTKKITDAIKIINNVAEETNVLALNAAIEASHAGDAGRGFSVVAKEVKKLAAETVTSTKMIQDLVQTNNKNMQETEKIIESTNSAIKKIADLSEEIKELITEQVQTSSAISTQLQSASIGAGEISSAITEIAHLGDNI